MVFPSSMVPVQGRASCPSTNNVRPICQRGGGVSNRRWYPQRLGHFSREGMKPSPAHGKCDPYLGILSLIRKYGVHDEAYLRRLNNRFAIHAASYLCKGYYRDTKLPFRARQQRWSTIAHDPWFRNMKLSDVESNGRKMIMFVCRWHLHWLVDPLLCILLKNH